MNPRSRRGDRRRWRSQQVPDERGHVGAPRTGVASDGPKGPPPDPYVPFFGRKGPLPFERRMHPGATFSARRRVLLYLHAIRRGHATGRGEFHPLLSVKEEAAYLGMSKDWVYENLKRLIPHVKIGGRSGSGRKTSTGTSRRRPSPRSTPRTSGLQSRFGRRCVSRDPYVASCWGQAL